MEVTGATHSAVAKVMGYYEKASAAFTRMGQKEGTGSQYLNQNIFDVVPLGHTDGYIYSYVFGKR